MLATQRPRRGPTERQVPRDEARTFQWRNWSTVNVTDARTAIGDDELAWLENAMPIGRGAIKILNGPGGTIATIAALPATLWGFVLAGTSITIAINSDGSVSQITIPGGVVTTIAAAGTVTSSAVCTIWRDTHVLILDPSNGYFSWDATTWTLIDVTVTGTSIAVFEGRAWIQSARRTIRFTAPNTYDDFTAGNGAGSTVLTDEAFPGSITTLVSAVEQLWIVGAGAIDAIANVTSSGTAPSVTTTFSVTNIVTNLGSNAAASVVGYFRALTLVAPFGQYALSGVTPQKISDKLDSLFPDLTLSTAPACVAVVNNKPCLFFLATYTGSNAQAGTNIPLLIGFTEGKYFFAVQRTTLRWITTVIVSGVSQAWAVDTAGAIYRVFGADDDVGVAYKIQSKLYDFGLSTTAKLCQKVGLEIQAENPVDPTLTIDSEFQSQTDTVDTTNALTLINSAGNPLTILNAGGNPLTIVTQALVLYRSTMEMWGHYLGWSLTGTDPPFFLRCVAFEVVMSREWSTP